MNDSNIFIDPKDQTIKQLQDEVKRLKSQIIELQKGQNQKEAAFDRKNSELDQPQDGGFATVGQTPQGEDDHDPIYCQCNKKKSVEFYCLKLDKLVCMKCYDKYSQHEDSMYRMDTDMIMDKATKMIELIDGCEKRLQLAKTQMKDIIDRTLHSSEQIMPSFKFAIQVMHEPLSEQDSETSRQFGKLILTTGEKLSHVPKISVISAGYESGSFMRATLNEKAITIANNHPTFLRGIVLIVIDPATHKVVHNKVYDTWNNDQDERKLLQDCRSIGQNMIVAMGVSDEGSNKLKKDTREIISKLGSKEIYNLGERQPWAFIGSTNNNFKCVEQRNEQGKLRYAFAETK